MCTKNALLRNILNHKEIHGQLNKGVYFIIFNVVDKSASRPPLTLPFTLYAFYVFLLAKQLRTLRPDRCKRPRKYGSFNILRLYEVNIYRTKLLWHGVFIFNKVEYKFPVFRHVIANQNAHVMLKDILYLVK